ncbi:MAG: RNA-guided pseudouridylation complex pseudouridine synthase subunit Cbf5 [Aigarchaeota archaeon]|nr:RNA-guided pseudouridylation complex pseudouridine synthase subunit Cbf5 [Candidatus Pelearchaeum maunauluense]
MLLEDAAKSAPAIMHSGKEYICLMELHGDVSDEELEDALQLFTGEIYQVPPVRSSVARRPRIRVIYGSRIVERDGRHVLLEVACSAGTYMRKLCHDIGEYLGIGAHMEELRRIRAGPFIEQESASLLDVYSAWKTYREEGDDRELRRVVRPVEECVKLLPKVYVLDTAVDAVCHGADLAVVGIARVESGIKEGDLTAIMTLKGELVALGTSMMSSEQMLEATEGIAIDTTRVIMERQTYPSIWKGGLRKRPNT